MDKFQQIDEILAQKPDELLLEMLWDDPSIVAKIRTRLGVISDENLPYYHKHFCGE